MEISRWNNDYNNLLIAKVESELQVAEQYLQLSNVSAFDNAGVSKNTNRFGGIGGLRKLNRRKSHTQNRKDQTYSSDHWIPSSGLIAL